MRHRVFDRRRLRSPKGPALFNPGFNFAVAATGMLALQPRLNSHIPNNNMGLVVAFMAGSLGSAIVSPALSGFFGGFTIASKKHGTSSSLVFTNSPKLSEAIVLKDAGSHKLGLVSSLSVTVLSSSTNPGRNVQFGMYRQGDSSPGSSSSGSDGDGHRAGSNDGQGDTHRDNGDDSTPPYRRIQLSSNRLGVRKVYDWRDRKGYWARKGSGGEPPSPPGGSRTVSGFNDKSSGSNIPFFLLVLSLVLTIALFWYTAVRYSRSSKSKPRSKRMKRTASPIQTQAVSDSVQTQAFFCPYVHDPEDQASVCAVLAVPPYVGDLDYRFMAQEDLIDSIWSMYHASASSGYCDVDVGDDAAQILFNTWEQESHGTSLAIFDSRVATVESAVVTRCRDHEASVADTAFDPKFITDICDDVQCENSEDDTVDAVVENGVIISWLEFLRGIVVSWLESLEIRRRLRRMVLPILIVVHFFVALAVFSLFWLIDNVDGIDVEFLGQPLNDPVGHLGRGVYTDLFSYLDVQSFYDAKRRKERDEYAKNMKKDEEEFARLLESLDRTIELCKIRNGTL
ncbi:hypothetical protein BDN70DRAFT_992876 [Pholiota conissans]|uniref:Uncharacterized protein n=1 Tax=Pholiota conissans TaxID=109636 RepID=A0A9P5Z5A7_9AGAR|nr:hypothetical protein BDN70DRAFT_992876 [Pholiota conissans]